MNIAFEPGDVDRLSQFLDLLLAANQQFNLTAITDPDVAWTRHVLDSLSLLPLLVSGEAQRIMDVGSGGGLPGIPLAIAMPDAHFTLLEATGKKARFLQEATAAIGLPNVAVVCARAEDAGHDPLHRDRYDSVTARAVGRLPVLLELTIAFARVGGTVLAMKGAKAAEEITEAKQALHLLHARVNDQHTVETGTIVVIEKLRPTPRAYPRKSGDPKRLPLGISPRK